MPQARPLSAFGGYSDGRWASPPPTPAAPTRCTRTKSWPSMVPRSCVVANSIRRPVLVTVPPPSDQAESAPRKGNAS